MRFEGKARGRKRRQVLALVACLGLLGAAAAQRPVTLSGTIVNPTGKSGTVVAWAGYFNMSPSGAVAFGEVLADGSFKFDLPAQLRGDVLHPIEAKNVCQSGGQDLRMQPSSALHILVNTLMAFDTTSTPVVAMLASSKDLLDRLAVDKHDVKPGDALGYYLYSYEPLTISGSCESADGLNVTYDVRASKGWNLISYTFEEQGGVVVGKFQTVRSLPAALTWVSLVD